jgi:type 1 fimbriae regulatory protein FimB/type 1 fimbriae regulatory protein FimE
MYRETEIGFSTRIVEKGRFVPKKPRNDDIRSRKYLTENEVNKLVDCAFKIPQTEYIGLRNAAIILVGFRHALRRSEIIALKWDQIDFEGKIIHVNRLKHGRSSVQPLKDIELTYLTKLYEQRNGEFVFTQQNGMPLSRCSIHVIIVNAGKAAGLPFPISPHMLRHSTGYFLANKDVHIRAIQDYLGHNDITKTVIYTQLAHGRFNDFWSD